MLRAVTMLSLVGFAAMLVAQTTPQDRPINQPRQPMSPDAKFVMGAVNGGNYEIQSSRLAINRSQDPNVKKIAQQMIDEHTKANQELMRIVEQKRMPMPPSQQLDPVHAAMLQKLSAEQGKDFDECYIGQQVLAHVEAVLCFTKQAKKGQDTELKAFAEKTLPKLKEHKEMVKHVCENHLETGTYESMKHPIKDKE